MALSASQAPVPAAPVRRLRRICDFAPLADREPATEEAKEASLQFERVIRPPLQTYLNLSVTFAASDAFRSPSLIRASFKRTERLLVHRFYRAATRLIFADSIQEFRPPTASQRSSLDEVAARLCGETASDEAQKGPNDMQALLLRYRPLPSDVLQWMRPEIAKAVLFIRRHIADELKIESFAEEAGLSPSHLSFLFKNKPA